MHEISADFLFPSGPSPFTNTAPFVLPFCASPHLQIALVLFIACSCINKCHTLLYFTFQENIIKNNQEHSHIWFVTVPARGMLNLFLLRLALILLIAFSLRASTRVSHTFEAGCDVSNCILPRCIGISRWCPPFERNQYGNNA